MQIGGVNYYTSLTFDFLKSSDYPSVEKSFQFASHHRIGIALPPSSGIQNENSQLNLPWKPCYCNNNNSFLYNWKYVVHFGENVRTSYPTERTFDLIFVEHIVCLPLRPAIFFSISQNKSNRTFYETSIWHLLSHPTQNSQISKKPTVLTNLVNFAIPLHYYAKNMMDKWDR